MIHLDPDTTLVNGTIVTHDQAPELRPVVRRAALSPACVVGYGHQYLDTDGKVTHEPVLMAALEADIVAARAATDAVIAEGFAL